MEDEMTDSPTLWMRVLFDMLVVAQLVKKFPALIPIILITRTHQWMPS